MLRKRKRGRERERREVGLGDELGAMTLLHMSTHFSTGIALYEAGWALTNASSCNTKRTRRS